MTEQEYDECWEKSILDCKRCSSKECMWWDIENNYDEKELFMIGAARLHPTILPELKELMEEYGIVGVYNRGLSDMYDYMKKM